MKPVRGVHNTNDFGQALRDRRKGNRTSAERAQADAAELEREQQHRPREATDRLSAKDDSGVVVHADQSPILTSSSGKRSRGSPSNRRPRSHEVS